MRFNVAHKLLFPITGFIIFLSIFMFVYFPQKQEEALTESFEREVQTLAETVALGLTIGLSNDDNAGIQPSIDYAKQTPDVEFVALVSEGSTFAAHPEDFIFQDSLYKADNLVIKRSKISTGIIEGEVIVGRNTIKIRHRIKEIRTTTGIVAGATLLLGILFGLVQAFFIVRPLRQLRGVAVRVGKGDLATKVERSTNDEIGDLADEFSNMITNVRIERQRSDSLLLNILPRSIATRMKQGETNIARHYPHVTVLFIDIAGFTKLASELPPQRLVGILDIIFSRFDDLADKYGLEKIKTIGDCYMVVGGVPEPVDDHALRVANMAVESIDVLNSVAKELNVALAARLGMHSGEVVAGVIGKKKFIYDLWGDTVNIASRMESHGVIGRVHCSDATYQLLRYNFNFEERGAIDIKGKGSMKTYLIGNKK